MTALAALRCEGVADDMHYPIGAVYPDAFTEPRLLWSFAPREQLVIASEDYDAQALSVGVGVTLSLLVARYQGTGQASEIADLPMWLDRLTLMLAGDSHLGDTLTRPMSGFVRKIGVLDGRRIRYVGLMMDLSLLVRIEAG